MTVFVKGFMTTFFCIIKNFSVFCEAWFRARIAQLKAETLPIGERKTKGGRSGVGWGMGSPLLCCFRPVLEKSSKRKGIKR